MKKLSIEEKAKRYDEVMGRAKKELDACGSQDCDAARQIFRLFPELKESGDERICGQLIAFLKQSKAVYGDSFKQFGLNIDDALAWLEKQGEQKSVPDWMPKFLDELRSKKNYFDWDEHKDIEGGILAIINWMNPNYFNEKDGEQKPIGKPTLDVEIPFGMDSELVEETMTIPKGCYAVIEDNKVVIRKGEKPAEWSKEDNDKIYQVLAIVDDYRRFYTIKPSLRKALLKDLDNIEAWLKSLKDRVLQQNITVTDEELAKVKKDAYNDALDKIEYHSGEPTFDDGWSAAIWYLKKKNARPQSHWKPSEEQMVQLHKYCPDNIPLTSLYEQLKKLREE